MALKNLLENIFWSEERERVDEIFQILDINGVNCEKDLEHLETEVVNFIDLNPIEKKKLFIYIEGLKNILMSALERIFGNENLTKLERFENYFFRNGVYSADDLALFDIEIIKNEKSLFTKLDLRKIEDYIRKNHPENYEEIKRKEDRERRLKEFEYEMSLRRREAEQANKERYLDSLLRELDTFSEQISTLREKMEELSITQTEDRSSLYNNFSDKIIRTAFNFLTMGPIIASIILVVESAVEVYSIWSRYSEDSFNNDILQRQLYKLETKLDKVKLEITESISEDDLCLPSSRGCYSVSGSDWLEE